MMKLTIELETSEQAPSPVLVTKNEINEYEADYINAEHERNHVVFMLETFAKDDKGRMIEVIHRNNIGIRSVDLVRYDISHVQELR
jgi:hypothetical protein